MGFSRSTKLLMYVISATSLLFTSVVLSGQVSAAQCNSSGTVGEISGNVNLPLAGEYVVWVRMQQSTPANNVIKLEIEGQTCYSVGSSSMAANSWEWINYQSSNQGTVMKHNFASSGSKSVKLLGANYDVKIDKIILLGTSELCESNGKSPFGDGSNCASGLTVVVPDDEGSTGVTPSIVLDNPENVDRVEYFIDGELVQESSGAKEFDASNLEEGEYDLTTKVYYKDGTVEQVEQVVKLHQETGILAAVQSWVAENKNPIYLGTLSVTLIGVVGGLVFLKKYLHHRHMYLVHHGIA